MIISGPVDQKERRAAASPGISDFRTVFRPNGFHKLILIGPIGCSSGMLAERCLIAGLVSHVAHGLTRRADAHMTGDSVDFGPWHPWRRRAVHKRSSGKVAALSL